MQNHQYIERVVNLMQPGRNVIYNMSETEATELVKNGSADDVRKIDGQFALVAVDGKTVRMARSLGRPLRYFIAKLIDGPCLVIAERIDTIHEWLKKEGLDDQFHPSYTRMAPAHYVTELALLGCPDPNPVHKRFFTPERSSLTDDVSMIGVRYMTALYNEIKKWLTHRAPEGPIGVSFSGGIDSGSVFLLTYHAMLELGMKPSRLKAFTLSVEGRGADLAQAREFLERVNLGMFLEPIEVPKEAVDWRETIKIVEDYKPLDIESATMNLALLRAIRERYPEWKFMLDGDGGDENLKDYPIEENPELTIRSVLNNLMLYQEGWGVESIKHSLTYSGGLSRAYTRTFAPAAMFNFEGFSPYTLPNVIEIAEAIPYIAMTDWDHDRLYQLKGEVVAQGVKAVTNMDMPIFPKRRFQHGVVDPEELQKTFPEKALTYRRFFNKLYERDELL